MKNIENEISDMKIDLLRTIKNSKRSRKEWKNPVTVQVQPRKVSKPRLREKPKIITQIDDIDRAADTDFIRGNVDEARINFDMDSFIVNKDLFNDNRVISLINSNIEQANAPIQHDILPIEIDRSHYDLTELPEIMVRI